MRQCKGPCGRNRAERFFTGPRGTVCRDCQKEARRHTSKAARLKALYAITMEEYRKLHDHQGGVCAVCGEPRRYELHVDHDHKVERELGVRASVRGLLCKRCNKLLRDCADSIPLLRALIEYLQTPPAKGIIE